MADVKVGTVETKIRLKSLIFFYKKQDQKQTEGILQNVILLRQYKTRIRFQ